MLDFCMTKGVLFAVFFGRDCLQSWFKFPLESVEEDVAHPSGTILGWWETQHKP